MKIAPLNNTEHFCLRALCRYRGLLKPLAIARMRYKTSQQWEKKEATYTKILDGLCRRGYAMKLQGGYTLTPEGSKAFSRRTNPAAIQPFKPRLLETN